MIAIWLEPWTPIGLNYETLTWTMNHELLNLKTFYDSILSWTLEYKAVHIKPLNLKKHLNWTQAHY
jgi:hypothetical protein